MKIIEIIDISHLPGYNITLNEVYFKNLTFEVGSYLISLSRHETVPITISALRMENISQGIIDMKQNSAVIVLDDHPLTIFSNVTAIGCHCGAQSLFEISRNSEITIEDSYFKNISTTGTGSVVYTYNTGRATITRSTFEYNMGFNGGVFATRDQSKIIITYSTMFNNLAIIDAVFKAYDLGAIEIHHSSITHNRAISTPIGEVFYSKMQSIISNTTINNNIRISNQEYLNSVEGLDLLVQFNQFVEVNKEEFSKGQLLWSIRVIFSDLIFENCTETPVEQGTLLFYAGNSVAIIRNCIFQNISFTVSIFIFSGSKATLQNLIFRNNTLTSHALSFIYCTSSVMKGSNLVFENSILNDVATDFSVVQLTNVTYRNITSQFKSLLTFQRGTSQEIDSEGNIVKSTLNNATFEDIVINGDNLIHWHGSKFDSVINLVVQNVSGLTMDLFDSDINLFYDVKILQTLE